MILFVSRHWNEINSVGFYARYSYPLNRYLLFSGSSSPYYASGGIYAQTETNVSLTPYDQTNHISHPSFNTRPNNYPRIVDSGCGTSGMRQSYQIHSYGLAPTGSERLQQPFNHRAYRSHSSGLRSGEGSSSGRSTTSGLGSGSTKFANGGGVAGGAGTHLPDSSVSR